jgi:hypothetical protein
MRPRPQEPPSPRQPESPAGVLYGGEMIRYVTTTGTMSSLVSFPLTEGLFEGI